MKYLLLLLPFMWGCAEKKVEKHLPGKVYFAPGTYNLDTVQRRILEGRAVFDTVYAAHDTLLLYYDSMAYREGISIDGVSDCVDSFPFTYTEDTLPGGHSIHAEPYDTKHVNNAREKLQAAFYRSYVKYVSPTFYTDSLIREGGLYKSLADTIKQYSKPQKNKQ